MPWLETSPVDERIAFVLAVRQGDLTISEASRRFGVSRKTGYKWLKLSDALGLTSLRDRSRRPLHSPGQISAELEGRIVALRKAHGWAGRKISFILKEREGTRVSRATVDRVIRRQGLVSDEPRGKGARLRFERSAPNELWQMDHKGEYQLADGRCMPLSVIDDHSRFAVGLAAQRSNDLVDTSRNLLLCFERYGLPLSMLMDHGSPWWSTTNSLGLTQLSVSLIEQGINLIYGAIRHPQTQGKVERFHRTLDRSLRHHGLPRTQKEMSSALARFLEEYNEVRPHESLDMAVPASRYVPSPRPYQPLPATWEYPEGSEVRRLNSAGCLDLSSERYFVCEALAGKDVWCRRFQNRILVTYRHMNIREVDRTTGRTTSLIVPSAKATPTAFRCNPSPEAKL
jgi:transposase InsO family protein